MKWFQESCGQHHHLGSWFQRCYKVSDHFGLGDCDAAHHKEDQEGMVTGMGPAHLHEHAESSFKEISEA